MNESNERYVRVPGELIVDQSLDDKRVLIYCALIFTKWNDGRSFKELVEFSGFEPKTGSGGMNAKIRAVVSSLIENGYMNTDYTPIEPNSFGIIHFREFEKLVDYKRENVRLNHWRCILLLSHIRKYMRKVDGVGEFYSDFILRISKSTGIPAQYIPTYIDTLEKVGILHSGELPRYKDRYGQYHTNVRLFVDRYRDGDIHYNYMQQFEAAKKHIIKRSDLSGAISYSQIKSDPDVWKHIAPIYQNQVAHVQISKPTSKSENPIAASFGRHGSLCRIEANSGKTDDVLDDQPSDDEYKLPF